MIASHMVEDKSLKRNNSIILIKESISKPKNHGSERFSILHDSAKGHLLEQYLTSREIQRKIYIHIYI